VRSHAASVERAQQEYDDRDEEFKGKPQKSERRRFAGSAGVAEDDGQLGPAQDDDALRARSTSNQLGKVDPVERAFWHTSNPSQEHRPPSRGPAWRDDVRSGSTTVLAEEQVDTELVELAEQAHTAGPVWETVVVDPELPAANAPRSVWGFEHAHKEHREQGDASAPVAREQPPERPRARGFLAARRLKRQQDRLAAKQAETEPVQITEETLPTASEKRATSPGAAPSEGAIV